MRITKLLSLASAVILGLSAVPMSASAADGVDANGRDLKYDVNLDGEVNYTDAMAIMTYYALRQTGTTGYEYRTAREAILVGINEDDIWSNIEKEGDINGDGYIDTKDAVFFLTYLDQTGYLFGDINQDGVINAVDASDILSYYAKWQIIGEITPDEYVACVIFGDANCDFELNAVDASTVLSAYAESQTN